METSDRRESIRPDSKMKHYWYLWMFFLVVVGVLSWSIPVAFFVPADRLLIYLLSVYLPTSVALIYTSWWIPKFYDTIEFNLGEDAVHGKYGVFFRREKEISYGRITMAGLSHGPLKRYFGVYNVTIHTAAMGGSNLPEMCLMNVKNGPEIRDEISGKIGKLSQSERRSVEERVLEELQKIREIMES
ncbi:MAG: Bacterial membrane flanked domain protein [Candidatus Methanolliviera sp. GoM_oil]|nr:MAG: Bacterial membrane flanked domain protein [Candidatus Methanolliviera sp. GoM_oil]